MKVRFSFSSGYVNTECTEEMDLDNYFDGPELELIETLIKEGREDDIPDYITKTLEASLHDFIYDNADPYWKIIE